MTDAPTPPPSKPPIKLDDKIWAYSCSFCGKLQKCGHILPPNKYERDIFICRRCAVELRDGILPRILYSLAQDRD